MVDVAKLTEYVSVIWSPGATVSRPHERVYITVPFGSVSVSERYPWYIWVLVDGLVTTT